MTERKKQAITRVVAERVKGKEYPTQLILSASVGSFRIVLQ